MQPGPGMNGMGLQITREDLEPALAAKTDEKLLYYNKGL